MRIAYILFVVAAVFVSSRIFLDVTSAQPTLETTSVSASTSDTTSNTDATPKDDATNEADDEAARKQRMIQQRVRELIGEDPSEVKVAVANDATKDVDEETPSFPGIHIEATADDNLIQLPVTESPEPAAAVSVRERRHSAIRQQTPLHAQMITPGNFEYVGAFRTPLSDEAEKRFSYGGCAVTYRPNGDQNGDTDGFPGSLFIVGHRHNQLVAEIDIPVPVISERKSLDDLPVAEVLQPFADVTGGIRARISGTSTEPFEIGGLQVVDDRLHWTLYKFYNVEGHDYYSHGVSTTNLRRPDAQGLWHLGPANSGVAKWHSYKHAGYICEVPQAIANHYLGGRNIMSGLQICTGLTKSSQGPALYAYRLPQERTRHGASLNAVPLLWYSMSQPVLAHHYADRWTGAAWLTLGDKQAVIVAGRKAHGPVHYGQARPGDCYPDKGYHGSSYEVQVLFYAPGDLVAATKRAVADVQPWYRWDSKTPGGSLNRLMFKKCGKDIGGIAYDRQNNLVYMVEVDAGLTSENEWETMPVVHVLRVVK